MQPNGKGTHTRELRAGASCDFGRLTISAGRPILPVSGAGGYSAVSFVLQPWQLLLLILAGWVNRQQQ
jgi:hypothetical protein